MKLWRTLNERNNSKVRLMLSVFFGLSFLTTVYFRYYHRAALDFNLSESEIIFLVVTLAVIINPRRVKIVAIGYLLFLTCLIIRGTIFHEWPPSKNGLMAYRFFSLIGIDLFYPNFIHLLAYLYFIFSMLKPTSKNELQQSNS